MSARRGTKEYRTPSVETYGTISDLTAGGSGPNEENVNGANVNRTPRP